jgi:hypothetical protein
LRNIQATGEFVVNLADELLAEQLTLTAGDYGALVRQHTVPPPVLGTRYKLPRL